MYEIFRFIAGVLLSIALFFMLIIFAVAVGSTHNPITYDELVRLNLLEGFSVVGPTILAIGLILIANLIKDDK